MVVQLYHTANQVNSPNSAGAVRVVGVVVNPLVESFGKVQREPRASFVPATPSLRHFKKVFGEHEVRVRVWIHLEVGRRQESRGRGSGFHGLTPHLIIGKK